MVSPLGERAIQDALSTGKALLHFISANDVGLTGGHQYGYYLHKAAWRMFTPHPPVKGENQEHQVDIRWQDGRVTHSAVKWYGEGSRSEYRLTRFQRDFPYRTEDCLGNLLVLIFHSPDEWRAYVLDLDDDIAEIQSALGIEMTGTFAVFDTSATVFEETENQCLGRHYREFALTLSDFPSGETMSNKAREAVLACVENYQKASADWQLLRLVEAEYELFRLIERRLCQNEINRLFKTVDHFLTIAATIMNRRKARAGRSLENHVEYLLKEAGLPFSMRPPVDGKPDVLFPCIEAYRNERFPVDKLTMLGIKRTCKDRWGQVLKEASRVPTKHLLTLQAGISPKQLDEMLHAGIVLVVPEFLQKQYPAPFKPKLLTVEGFIDLMKVKYAQ